MEKKKKNLRNEQFQPFFLLFSLREVLNGLVLIKSLRLLLLLKQGNRKQEQDQEQFVFRCFDSTLF